MFTKTVVLPLAETQLYDFLSILMLRFSGDGEHTNGNVILLEQLEECDSGVDGHSEFITGADDSFWISSACKDIEGGCISRSLGCVLALCKASLFLNGN